jgi:hypothetical protein
MSSGLASSSSAASLRGLLHQVDGRQVYGQASGLQRSRAAGPSAGANQIGVAVDELDVLDRDTELLAGQHGPGSGVTLTVGRGPRRHHRGAVRFDLDRPVLAQRPSAVGDLDVGRQADAQLPGPACRSAPLLLGPQAAVVRGLEDEIQGPLVVADVVGRADRCGEGKGVPRDEVAPPDLGGVHPDLGGEQVHGPLDGGAGFGPARAPIGHHRSGVGHDRGRVELDLRDVVHARRHDPGHVRQHRADGGIGSRVLQHGEAVGEHLAVAGATDLDILDLSPAVTQAQHAL